MRDKLGKYIEDCEKEYARFINKELPFKYDITAKKISLDKSEKEGFDSWATAKYDIVSGTHLLEIWEDIYALPSKYVVFHEFTHMLDAHTYVGNDKIKYVQNHGYTEFHAAQIETQWLLGATNISDAVFFSMDHKIKTITDEMTIKDFVNAPHRMASDMIARTDFPANIEALKVTLGLIFNYYGRRSICKKYANDFLDDADNTLISSLILPETVDILNVFLSDFLPDKKIKVLDEFYGKMIMSLINKNGLTD